MWVRGFFAVCALTLFSTRIAVRADSLEAQDEWNSSSETNSNQSFTPRYIASLAANFAKEINVWARLGEETKLFKDVINLLKIPFELQRIDWRHFPSGRDAGICTICKGSVKAMIDLRRSGATDELIHDKAKKLCVLLNLQTADVCTGVIDLNLPTILYIIDNKPNLTSSTICGVLLESQTCPITSDEFEWTVNVDSSPISLVPPRLDDAPLKVLQITDLHYDPNYEPYGNADCKEPTCCRKGQNSTNNSGKVAGYWGDYYYCDTPWHSVIDALDHIKETHQDYDYVYFTGDVIDHGVWATSKEGNIASLRKSYGQFAKTFGNIPVYPILGNHEPHPLNLFSPKSNPREDLSTRWVYDFIAEVWIGQGWLPESTRSTIIQGGFYTVSPRKGFRIIVLNSNVCYCYNWWLWYDPKDPDSQLQWLSDTLSEAERNEEFVHILTHVPANEKSCINVWRREYLKIISRYSHVVKAQFTGHTHNDEIQVFYNEKRKPITLGWNGGSITTYHYLNPNYKLYYIDGTDYSVTDYDNWMYNLTAANETPNQKPKWFKSYSFKEEYGLTNATPETMGNWLNSVTKSNTLLTKYYTNFYKHAEPSLSTPCDDKCKQDLVCHIITSMDADQLCNQIKN